MEKTSRIIPIEISDEMKKSYIDYSMSVIAGRALPDVRDGLKPVHRRILYSMSEQGITPDKPYRKSARIVGDARLLGSNQPLWDAHARARKLGSRWVMISCKRTSPPTGSTRNG